MPIGSRMTDQDESKRYQTLPISQLDEKYLSRDITQKWREANNQRQEFLVKRQEWTENWRNLNTQRTRGPWENSSDFNIPITLIDGKAIHARLWQLFSDPINFFKVKARQEVFEDKEEKIKQFMQFVVWDYCNSKIGARDVFDEWVWDVDFEGSGYLKLYWQTEKHRYLEVVPVVSVEENILFDRENLTGRSELSAVTHEKEEIREEVLSTPQIKRILIEDIVLPIGEGDPQTARWCAHRIFMTSEDLKMRAQEGKFDKEAVQEVLDRNLKYTRQHEEDQVKMLRREVDGFFDPSGYIGEHMAVIEWYGKAYVEEENINNDVKKDVNKTPQEVVIWMDQATSKIIGWTYLYRISPSGIRPIFKSDFIKFPDRSHGVGTGEVMAQIQQAINATYNLRQDNGVLASTPFGFYRSASGLKPDKMRIEPGTFLPVDDVQDLRVVQMPFLQGFGYNEEDRLNGYAERLLNISDIQLGRTPNKVGTFRTASGSAYLQQESGIQLEIHFDRLARTLSRLLQALFRLCRERMPNELYYRITGENGEPIFGKVNREDLKGEYDFEISVDILGESRIEAQQKAVMMMQTLINPAFTQVGVITPSNLYQLCRNFLIKNRISRPDNFITKPQDYQGDVVSPAERVFRIVVNSYVNPPVEDTVRLGEDHEAALKFYEGFKQSDEFGLLTKPDQLAALQRLEARHQQMMMAQQAGGNPNMTGMQTPREGFAPMESGGMSQGTLGAPQGEVNGPVA